jgi:hypothetical protein
LKTYWPCDWQEEVEPVIIDIGIENRFGLKEGYQVVEDGVIDAYKWVDKNACNIAVTAAIYRRCMLHLAFTPAQPEGAATSTTLSSYGTTSSLDRRQGTKAVTVVAGMSTLITDAFLLRYQRLANSIDETLCYTNISFKLFGCKSLDSAELWATPAGVGIAIAAAFAPVIADLICNKTCPEGFTKAFGA